MAVALGVGDAQSLALATALGSLLGAGSVHRLGQGDAFLGTVFAARHPAAVLALGHYERQDVVGEPVGDRIQLRTTDAWLQPWAITESSYPLGGWSDPRPLVLLLACGSAAVRPTDLTSFLSALNGASAGAIVGTACDITTGLALDFVTALFEALRCAGPEPTGFAAAVAAARRSLVLEKGDVRGFAFEAFGPAELVLT
jgi:hypothetical protein